MGDEVPRKTHILVNIFKNDRHQFHKKSVTVKFTRDYTYI